MNRTEFMAKLEGLLQDIQESERIEALQYYNNYFDDAGVFDEQNVISELESPEKVAAIIKAGLDENSGNNGEYTETGYQDDRFRYNYEVRGKQNRDSHEGYDEGKKRTGGNTLLFILIAVITFPIWFPIGAAVLSVAFAFVVVALVLLVVAAFLGVGFLIAGIILIIVGIAKVFIAPPTGILVCGTGLIMLAAGILLTLLMAWICIKFIPMILSAFVHLCSWMFNSKRRGA